jgi:hypothetical protein
MITQHRVIDTIYYTIYCEEIAIDVQLLWSVVEERWRRIIGEMEEDNRRNGGG